jgi:hypothetical protein
MDLIIYVKFVTLLVNRVTGQPVHSVVIILVIHARLVQITIVYCVHQTSLIIELAFRLTDNVPAKMGKFHL